MCRMLDSTRADFLFLSLVPRDERGREFTGGQGSRRLKRCFVSGSSRWKERASPIFLSFSFSPFLSLPPLPFHRGTRFAKIPAGARSLFARLWGREGNWWGNRVAGVGRGSASAAERRFSRALSTHRERCVRRCASSCARACVRGEGKGIRGGIGQSKKEEVFRLQVQKGDKEGRFLSPRFLFE